MGNAVNEFLDIAKCAGCGACVSVCPKNAVRLTLDEWGFYCPEIDASCVSCGKCAERCPALQKPKPPAERKAPAAVYKAYSLDREARLQSTSGGIFSALAGAVIEKQGAVFGARLDRDLRVRHACAYNKEELAAFRGSKYVGSDTGLTFREAENLLKKGYTVLYSGTPCQVAGLYAALSGEYGNLYTCDFVCHGVASQTVFDKFIQSLPERETDAVKHVFFRNKERGYMNSQLKVVIAGQNGGEYEKTFPSYKNTFGTAFADGRINRRSCESCHYASVSRGADITLADMIDALTPDEAQAGCSLVLVNSKKGEELIELCRPGLFCTPLPLEEAIRLQPHLSKPTPAHAWRDRILSEAVFGDFEKAKRKYLEPFPLNPSLRKRLKQKIASLLKL